MPAFSTEVHDFKMKIEIGLAEARVSKALRLPGCGGGDNALLPANQTEEQIGLPYVVLNLYSHAWAGQCCLGEKCLDPTNTYT